MAQPRRRAPTTTEDILTKLFGSADRGSEFIERLIDRPRNVDGLSDVPRDAVPKYWHEIVRWQIANRPPFGPVWPDGSPVWPQDPDDLFYARDDWCCPDLEGCILDPQAT